MMLPKYSKVELNPDLQARLLATALRAADAASVPTLANFRQKLNVENKEQPGSFDPVTIADRQAEQVIKKVVLDEFPEHGFFGEESEPRINSDQPLWIVDPIDGTRAYITGMPLWGTLIAVYDGEDVVIGVLEQPVLQERFIATDFSIAGAASATAVARTSKLLTAQGQRSLSTRKTQLLSDAIVQTTTPEFFIETGHIEVLERIKSAVSMVRYGGDCYCYALLAMGFVDIVIETGLAPYDIAALIPIVQGAGGIVTSWDDTSAVSGGSVLACANEQLHEQVLALIR